MVRPSPFARGFRALRREPSVLLAEIAWRWLFGGIALALIAWAAVVFLHSVTVSKVNQLLLRTLNPAILQYILRELLHNKWGLLARLGLILGVSLSLLWIISSTIARSATTRVLLERISTEDGEERGTSLNLRSVAAIQFKRVALLWVGFAAYFASAYIAARLTTDEQVHTGAFLLLFLMMFVSAAAILSFFNWILLLAPIFAIRDSLSFFRSMAAAWQLTVERSSSLLALNLAHLALRLVWFVFMSGVAVIPLGFTQILPKFLIFARHRRSHAALLRRRRRSLPRPLRRLHRNRRTGASPGATN